MLKSFSVVVNSLNSPFNSFDICSMYFEAMLINCRRIQDFNLVDCIFFSLLYDCFFFPYVAFALMVILFDISMILSAFFR